MTIKTLVLPLLASVFCVSSYAAEGTPSEPLPLNVFRNLRAGSNQTVVVYGTSLSHTAEWPKVLDAYFQKEFPGQISFVNAASSGKQSDWGVANLKSRVLSKNPDLIFIEFSMNDAATKHNISVEKALTNLNTMVKALHGQNPQIEIVLMTMNTVWDTPANPGTNSASARPHLADYYESYRRYAREHDLPLIDHETNWVKLHQQDLEKFRRWLPDGTHPIPEASLAVTWPAIEALLEQARKAAGGRVAPTARIARFAGDCAAAISYTFDDGLRDQFTHAVPMLNEVGFKGTFFVIPGSIAETTADAERRKNAKRAWGTITWTELQSMSAQGHEIGSHTWSHRSLPKLTAAEVDTELSKSYDAIKTRIGKPPLTLAFPFNQSTPEVKEAALRYHVAYRAYQVGTGSSTTTASLNTWADKLVKEGKWGILMTHGITNGYASMSGPEVLSVHWKYVKGRERDFWVDTFANIARYEKERDDAKLLLTGKVGNVTCTLTSTLDPQLYDVPLTIVVDAPGVTSALAERGGQELPAHVVKGSILVQAAPSTQPVTITWK